MEMFDQTVREESGGAMAVHLRNASASLKAFALDRLGAEVRLILEPESSTVLGARKAPWWRQILRRLPVLCARLRERSLRWLLGGEYQLLEVARFRRSGEIHFWMPDRLSLCDLMKAAGFCDIRQVEAHESAIPRWDDYQLDTGPDGALRKPDSLFMEGTRPDKAIDV
jgi:hypothetical protein